MKSIYDIEICDCHHHLWDLQANYYPWLTDSRSSRVCGEYEAIRHKDFLLADFFENRLANAHKALSGRYGAQMDVLAERRFLGFDAWRNLRTQRMFEHVL